MKVQFVCGTFDEGTGHISTIGERIGQGLIEELGDITMINSGNITMLPRLSEWVREYDVVIWIPNISNSIQTKYVDEIKKINKKCILVISKRNESRYSLAEIIDRALKKHANLIVEVNSRIITSNPLEKRFLGRLLDPLGNVFCDWTENFHVLGKSIGKRIKELRTFTRFGSNRVGDAVEVPEETEFFELVKAKAFEFQKLIPSVQNPSRFLGNASFRCRHGFPSFRHGDYIFISRRNVDKEYIDRNGFLAVRADTIPIEYFGNYKPSVDTPTQLILYQAFPKINYILHGHVYLYGFPITNICVPCGAIEEAHEIRNRFAHPDYISFGINLKGHGFLAASNSAKHLGNIIARLKARPIPEIMYGGQ